MATTQKTTSKICPSILATIGGSITIMLYFSVAAMESWLAFSQNFQQPYRDFLMWGGTWFCSMVLCDTSFLRTWTWVAPIYPLMVMLTLISVVGIFYTNFESFSYVINAIISIIVSFVVAHRIMHNDFASR